MVEFDSSGSLDTSRMGSGGGGGGGKLAVGGVGGLIIALIALFFGVDLSGVTGGQTAPPASQSNTGEFDKCTSLEAVKQDPNCRFTVYENSLNKYWESTLTGYRPIAKLQTFTGSINTACGAADSSVGPFYCPGDRSIYVDTGFLQVLLKKLGARGGESAELYVIAHEYGHHIQNLTGVMDRAQRDRSTGPDSSQVRLELQADCFAGAYLKWAAGDNQDLIATFTKDDLDRAVDAAIAVGDDRIQQRSTGRVDRESWTHGSAAMRKKWLAVGWNTGDPRQCNTFAPNANLTSGQ